jgi:tetratricopeptide (TPR) repeat protein
VYLNYGIEQFTASIHYDSQELNNMDQLSLLLESYNTQIKSLNVSSDSSSVAQANVIDILLTRDRIDKILQDSNDISSDLVIQLMNLDEELASKKDIVASFFELANQYKEKNNFPNQDRWWWNLDEAALKSHPLNRYDWFFNLAKLGLWTFDVALLVTLINKILLGSSGLAGAGAIAVSTFLPILQARSIFTPGGQKQFNSLLRKLEINRNWTEEIQFIITLLITLFLWMLSINLPKILAQLTYNQGEKMLYDSTKTKEVEKAFKRAIELNPEIKTNVANAYFNEGKKKFDEGVKKVKQNKWEESEKLLTRAIELEPNMDVEPADLDPKPFCFSTRKNIKEAVACFTTQEGIREADKKNWEKSERLFKKAIELDASQTRAYDELGDVYENLQQFDDAEKYYLIAVRKGDYSSSFIRLARLYLLKSSQIKKIMIKIL